jgi:hypothetical protein
MSRLAKLLSVAALATSAGCILPISTGAPLPATTVGAGRFGGAISAEAPVLNLIANGTGPSDWQAEAPAAAMTFTLSYGLGDSTDLEVAGEGALYYFILPLPTGGSIGLRQHIAASDLFDFALAAKVGTVGGSASTDDSSGSSTSTSASANYTAIQGVLQVRHGWARPMAAISVMPARIKRDPSDASATTFAGLASSLTLGVMATFSAVQLGPYFTVTNFASERYDNGWISSGGLMLAVRPDRNARRRAPALPETPSYGPPPPAPAPVVPSGPPGSTLPTP